MLDLLDTPLRLTWDLHGLDGRAALQAPKLAAALVAAEIFFVTLQEHPLRHPAIGEVLAVLAEGGVQTLLVSTGSATETAALRPTLPIAALFLDAAPYLQGEELDDGGLRTALARLREGGYEPGLLWVPRGTQLAHLPRLLALCRQAGIRRFKLPNLPIRGTYGSPAPGELLRPADLAALRQQLGIDPARHRRGVALEVHDLFLWELLFPAGGEGRGEYEGCQAGNSLGHLDAAGNLLPCSSWPQSLGSLHESSLAAIWESPARLELRRAIAALPAGCRDCRDQVLCLGGCRGLALAAGAPAAPDPACAGPRGKQSPRQQ